jgi:hypothetical protein
MIISSIFGMGMDPPPSDAECDAISGDAQTRAICGRLQDPAVWYSGPTGRDDYPPVPG